MQAIWEIDESYCIAYDEMFCIWLASVIDMICYWTSGGYLDGGLLSSQAIYMCHDFPIISGLPLEWWYIRGLAGVTYVQGRADFSGGLG